MWSLRAPPGLNALVLQQGRRRPRLRSNSLHLTLNPKYSNRFAVFLLVCAAGVDLFVTCRETDSRYTRAERLKIASKLTQHVKPNLLPLACRGQVSCNDPQLDTRRQKAAVGLKMSPAANKKRKQRVNILFFKMKTKCICRYWVLCSLQYIISNLEGGRGECTDWLCWSAQTGMSTIKSRTFVEDGKQESSQTAPWRRQATPPPHFGCSRSRTAGPHSCQIQSLLTAKCKKPGASAVQWKWTGSGTTCPVRTQMKRPRWRLTSWNK